MKAASPVANFTMNFLPSSQTAYEQLDKPEGRTLFAGDYLSHLVAWQERCGALGAPCDRTDGGYDPRVGVVP